jgi:hypothetical protein
MSPCHHNIHYSHVTKSHVTKIFITLFYKNFTKSHVTNNIHYSFNVNKQCKAYHPASHIALRRTSPGHQISTRRGWVVTYHPQVTRHKVTPHLLTMVWREVVCDVVWWALHFHHVTSHNIHQFNSNVLDFELLSENSLESWQFTLHFTPSPKYSLFITLFNGNCAGAR